MAKVAINGFGRIGRNALRAWLETPVEGVEIVAINDPLQDTLQSAHLLKYDSILGELANDVSHTEDALVVDGKSFQFFREKDPGTCPWGRLKVDIVLECSGVFTDADKARGHINAGAKKVIISAPAKGEDVTIVIGVNDKVYDPDKHHIISNASCTTNCLAPVAKVLDEAFGIESGLMTTVHSYTGDQRLLDAAHRDLRRARAAALAMVPSTTGAAKAIGLVLPNLKGKLNGFAMRVPTPNVSIVDLVVTTRKNVTNESVNAAFKDAAAGSLKGILGVCDAPLVSVDFCGNKLSSIVDAELTMTVADRMVKVLAWYDNEWAYSHRLVELAGIVARKLAVAKV